MNKGWIDFLDEINEGISEIEKDSDVVFFRGHPDNSMTLQPSLMRHNISSKYPLDYIEKHLYYDFISNAGSALKGNKKSWEILFLMRHYGMPTRLLDWSENFAVALYFAIEDPARNNPEIWLLNPIKLNAKNKEFGGRLINPELDINYSYYDAFISKTKKPFKYPLALYPYRNNPRILSQKGLFTIHGTNETELEKMAKDTLIKVSIPPKAIEDARQFLKLTGINEHSIYTDLDSLSRHFKKKFDY